MRLRGKTAIITGGTSGIGRRMVERFVEEGARVFFTGRRAELGAEVARASGATFVHADAALEADAQRTIGAATANGGRLDILVNNAGIAVGSGRLETVDLADLDTTLAVHVRGPFALIKHAAPLMRAQAQGSIINITSVAGHRAGYSSSISYSIAKAALLHLTRCAALELGEDGVRVNAISPGVIATGIFGKAMGVDVATADAAAVSGRITAAFEGAQPIPRAGVTDDIAHAAVYLASDESSFVNGEDIVVDGGLIQGRRYSEASAGRAAMRQLFG